MALGWLYLYSRYRKTRENIKAIEEEFAAANEICNNCGYPRHKHANDTRELCPVYFTEDER